MDFRDILYSLRKLGALSFGVYLMIDSVIQVESPLSISKFAVGTVMIIELIRVMRRGVPPRVPPPPELNVNGFHEMVGIPPDDENGELDGIVIWEPLLRDVNINALAILAGGFVFDTEAIERLATGSDTHLRGSRNFTESDLKDYINVETLLHEEDLAFIGNQFMKIADSETNNARVVLRRTKVAGGYDIRQKTAKNSDLKPTEISASLCNYLAQTKTETDKNKALGLIKTDRDKRYHWKAETNANEIKGFGKAVIKITADKALELAETLFCKDKAAQHAETQIIRYEASEHVESSSTQSNRDEALENAGKTEDEIFELAGKQSTEDEALRQVEIQVTKNGTLKKVETKITIETSTEAKTDITEYEVLEQSETEISGDEALGNIEGHITNDKAFWKDDPQITENEKKS